MNKPFAKAFDVAKRYRGDLCAEGVALPLFAKKESRGKLYIYEQIGADWWTGEGVTAKSVATALDEMKGITGLDIFVNSPGGDVFEGKAIYALLCRFEGEKVVYVDGVAASAASFIAMAGDRIVTAPAATWMVHEAVCGAVGRAEDMRAMGDLLEMLNADIAAIYAKRSGRSVEEMLAVMAAETWMNAEEALAQKFTDEIAADEPAAESATASSAYPMVAAAAITQLRIKTLSTSKLLEMHLKDRPGQPGERRPASR